MKVDLNTLEKLYYSIGEVSELFSVSKSLIRYWETEFDFLNPRKNKKGDRRFTKDNIAQLEIIFDLVKVRGFTLEGARQEIKSQKRRLTAKSELETRLLKVRKNLQTLNDSFEDE